MDKDSLVDVILNTKKSNTKSNSDLDIDSDDLQQQITALGLENQRYRSDTRDRKWLASWTAFVVSIWLFVVLVILFLNSCCLELSDNVLVALLGTTTLNVLGLSFIVLKGHFNSVSK